MDEAHCSLDQALIKLEELAPGAPLLALGQTAFWDEPMKAGVALALDRLGLSRRFVAAVHDTDYFAKLPLGPREPGRFQAMPHNATTTRDLWSAAGEFSALFGSETVINRHDFLSAGLNVEKVQRYKPDALDEASEAFGWRGVVALDESPPVVAELPLQAVFPELERTLRWAVERSLDCIVERDRPNSLRAADRLFELVCEHAGNGSATLSSYYRSLLPELYAFAAGRAVPRLDTATTTELLRFDSSTCDEPQFELVQLFLDPRTREVAREAYDRALKGTEVYTLDRFGSGAIPFDLFVPGKGRGTLRIAKHAVTVMSRQPQFISLERPVESVRDLAEAIERKFGKGCALIGKAVTLIGQLARRYVFVFHEGASGYVRLTRKFHGHLVESGIELAMHPILRVRYRSWDCLEGCCVWFRLPEPLQEAFGAEEMCAPSFAARWREVRSEQEELLRRLGELHRPVDLIRFLDERFGGAWRALADEYLRLHSRLDEVSRAVAGLKSERRGLYGVLRDLKARRVQAERAKGEHFRAKVFEKNPSEKVLAERRALAQEVERIVHEIAEVKERIRRSAETQARIVGDPELLRIHERRRSIELEAELKRLRLIRCAVIASKGLTKASHRPSAWWFPLVCPEGKWFENTANSAECYFEPLIERTVGKSAELAVVQGCGD